MSRSVFLATIEQAFSFLGKFRYFPWRAIYFSSIGEPYLNSGENNIGPIKETTVLVAVASVHFRDGSR